MLVLHPSNIQTFTDSGTGSMGDVVDVDSKARFWLDADYWFLVFIRGGFTGGTSQNDLAIRLDSRHALPDVTEVIGGSPKTTPFDFTLYTLKNIGTDSRQLNHRIQPLEYPTWTFRRGDILVLEWTNPNTQSWAIEVGLGDADALQQV